ncbi:LOW QUALITY PROTEIN: hypothetical protein M513_12590, partial [Trichuris suis]
MAGISLHSAFGILHETLGLRELSARWVPKALREEQLVRRVNLSRELLTKIEANETGFFDRIITENERWIYQYDPEIVFTRKKSGEIRFCVDYRELNKRTIKDAYPLPLSDEVHDRLSGATVFSTLDLNSGFWQLPIHPDDRHKTSFCPGLGFGLFEFCRMPFRLCGDPRSFQRLMDTVLRWLVMLENGIIQPSSSPWLAPAVFTRKKSGEIRFCVDYRELNKRTIKDAYPLPLPDEVHDRLSGATVFSTLDLNSGFWQLPIHPDDRHKTAFCPGPGLGLFEFCRMPFGLCGGPSSFQRLMDTVLRGLPFAMVYLDDVLVFSKDHDSHREHLKLVFLRCKAAGLTIRGAKCQIGRPQVRYLGRIFSSEGMSVDPLKTADVVNWPQPANVTDARRFIGLASYYRRYGKDFATVAKPLHQLTVGKAKFNWDEQCEEAFHLLKKALTTAPTLAAPDFHREFQLHTDASSVGLGAVLEQDGHVVSYASRLLRKAERNYSTIETECLALMFAIKQFHFTIKYKKGLNNGNADALSTLGQTAVVATAMPSAAFRLEQIDTWRTEQAKDITIAKLIKLLRTSTPKDGVVFRKPPSAASALVARIPLAPPSLRPTILSFCHDVPAAGHMGFDRTLDRVRRTAFWPGFRQEVREYCEACPVCQMVKAQSLRPPMQIAPTGLPWERVAVDVLHLPLSKTKKVNVLTVQDYFTKWLVVRPIPDQTAETTVASLLQIFADFGPPSILHSDQGRNFESLLLEELCSAFGIRKTRCSLYIQKEMVLLKEELMFARPSTCIQSRSDPEPSGHAVDDYYNVLKRRMTQNIQEARRRLQEAAIRQKAYLDATARISEPLSPGTPVFVKRELGHKLQPKWQSGWVVVQQPDSSMVRVKHRDGTEKVLNLIKVKPCRPRAIQTAPLENTHVPADLLHVIGAPARTHRHRRPPVRIDVDGCNWRPTLRGATPVTKQQLRQHSLKDAQISDVIKYLERGWPCRRNDIREEIRPFAKRREELSYEDRILLWQGRIVIPKVLHPAVLQIIHDGHLGICAMKSIARFYVRWPGLDSDIERYVRNCSGCQENQPRPPEVPLFSWNMPSEPWARLHVDLAGPFKNLNWLVIVDAYSKWLDVIPLRNTLSASLIKHCRGLFATFGLQRYIVSDNGPQFVSEEFATFCRSNNIVRTTPYLPKINGLAERAVRTFKERLAKAGEVSEMELCLQRFLFSYRNTPHATTGRSPAELLFGRRLRNQLDLLKPSLESTVDIRKFKQAEGTTTSFPAGEKVFVSQHRGGSQKEGVVIDRTAENSYRVECNDTVQRKHADQLRRCDLHGAVSQLPDDADVTNGLSTEGNSSGSVTPQNEENDSVLPKSCHTCSGTESDGCGSRTRPKRRVRAP